MKKVMTVTYKYFNRSSFLEALSMWPIPPSCFWILGIFMLTGCQWHIHTYIYTHKRIMDT